ncbi:hypothetical protein ACS0TY_032539 [Phlomoides rotata]
MMLKAIYTKGLFVLKENVGLGTLIPSNQMPGKTHGPLLGTFSPNRTESGNKMDAPKCGGVEPEKGKTTRARRSWTRIEEDALIHCLLDIVSDGWKADNGFKAGF